MISVLYSTLCSPCPEEETWTLTSWPRKLISLVNLWNKTENLEDNDSGSEGWASTILHVLAFVVVLFED